MVAVGIIACATLGSTGNSDGSGITSQSTAQWKVKAPDLFANAGYIKLTESINIVANTNESIQRLQGRITNLFGIRDDVLEFIIKNVPNDNEKAKIAAIKLAQSDYKIYYGNVSQVNALLLANHSVLIGYCLMKYLPNNEDLKITRGIEKIMMDTKERNQYMWAIDRKYFSWKVIGSGLSIADENIACEQGDF